MGEAEEFRCFIGGLAWATTDRSLRDAFEKFGHLVEARVAVDKFSGRSRGFGFVTFDEKKSMEEAIEEMHGLDLDGRSINVEKAQPNQGGSGRDRDDRSRDRGDRDRDRGRDRGSRDFGGGRGSGGGGDCFKCGKPGHFARECPGDGGGGGGGRYGGRDGGRDDRYGGGRDGGRDDRYSGGEDGGRGSRSGPDRNGDRYGGRSKDSSGGDRHSRDRSAPYERRSSSGYRG